MNVNRLEGNDLIVECAQAMNRAIIVLPNGDRECLSKPPTQFEMDQWLDERTFRVSCCGHPGAWNASVQIEDGGTWYRSIGLTRKDATARLIVLVSKAKR